MKDLDFDELDKAVNSLMTGAGTAKQPSQGEPDTGGEKTLDITPTLAGDAAPSFEDLNEAVAKTTGVAVASSTPAATPATTPSVSEPASTPAVDPTPPQTAPVDAQTPLAARRGGRFMDVVHPSSDMKKTVVPPRPVSREGVMIGRTSAAPASSTPEAPVADESTTETPVAAEAPAPDAVATSSNEWPDPLEMADFKAPATPQMTNDNLAADLLAEADKTEQEEKTDGGTPPLTSPFLSGAKVEKRPLGSGVPAYTDDTLTTEKEDKTVDNPDAQLPASPSDAPVLPEELQGDLMAIEADTHMGVPKTDESHPVAPVEPLPEEKSEPVVATVEEKPKDKASEPTTERAVPTGPISIPQQYREEPSTTADEKAGTIYDTDSYHKPLAHPAKKKPGWTWVVAIIVILIVGAGGGAALYFLGIV